MKRQAAIFDVDGTIIHGNCTQIYVQYLLEEEIIEHADFAPYNFLRKTYSPENGDYNHIAQEAFKLLSKLKSKDLLSFWEKCFYSKVLNKLNK
jgi:FMN phosphatase YigB (HAD superfamily)